MYMENLLLLQQSIYRHFKAQPEIEFSKLTQLHLNPCHGKCLLSCKTKNGYTIDEKQIFFNQQHLSKGSCEGKNT